MVLAVLGRRLWVAVLLFAVPLASALRRGHATSENSLCQKPISFEDFVKKYNRHYVTGSDEYLLRAQLFAKRLEAVNEHNCGDHSGQHTWKASINNLADWSEEALESLTGSKHADLNNRPKVPEERGTWTPSALYADRGGKKKAYPSSVSWGHLPAIRQPRHQGHCGSCWALTALTVVGAFLDIRNKSTELSLAQVVACTPNPRSCGGTGGCKGATSGLAFNYIMHAGLVPAVEFPYPFSDLNFRDKHALHCPQHLEVDADTVQRTFDMPVQQDGSQVRRRSAGGGAHQFGMVGWKRLPENKEHELVRALVEQGPLAVSVATGPDWHVYGGGVFPADRCDPNRILRHATVLFGYGTDDAYGMRFWRLKNSWGADWGESGTMRLERLDDEEANCGWDDAPEKGSECRNGRSRVWVCGSCGIIHEATAPIFA